MSFLNTAKRISSVRFDDISTDGRRKSDQSPPFSTKFKRTRYKARLTSPKADEDSMEQPSKQESQQILAAIKSKGGAANKVKTILLPSG